MESPRSRSVGISVKNKTVKIINDEVIYLKKIDHKEVIKNVEFLLESQIYLDQSQFNKFFKLWRKTPRLKVTNSELCDISHFECLVICLWKTLIDLYESSYDEKKASDVNNLHLRSSWRELIMSDIESSVYLHENEEVTENQCKASERREQLNSMWLMSLEMNDAPISKNMLDDFAIVVNAVAKGIFSTLILCLSLIETSHDGSGVATESCTAEISTNVPDQSLDSRLIQLGGASLKSIHALSKNLLRKNIKQRTQARNHLMLVRAFSMTQSEKLCHLPQSLRLRDKGFLYFLKKVFDPFLRAVDSKIKENMNKGKLLILGSKVAAVSCPKVKYDNDLEAQFMKIADSITGENSHKKTFYRMFISKLVNARFNDFLFASYSEKTPKGGFLLRDKLGTMSIKKSSKKIKKGKAVQKTNEVLVITSKNADSCAKKVIEGAKPTIPGQSEFIEAKEEVPSKQVISEPEKPTVPSEAAHKKDMNKVPIKKNKQRAPRRKCAVRSQETQEVNQASTKMVQNKGRVKSPAKREHATVVSKIRTPPPYKPKSKRLTTKPKKLDDYYH